MAPTLYCNKPGGVVVPTQDGSTKTVAYGEVWPADAQPYVDSSRFADSQQRISGSQVQLEAAAHARAAKAENGQVNSSSSPVPGNYNDLPEDAAALLVANLERYPESQASVLIHEILYGGNRQKVIDSASERARISAHAQIAADLVALRQTQDHRDTPSGVAGGDPSIASDDTARTQALATARTDVELPPPSSSASQAAGVTGDPNRFDADGVAGDLSPEDQALLAQIESRRGKGETKPVDSFDDPSVTKAQLDAYAEQHDIADYPKTANKAEKVAAIQAAGHDKPETPLS